jgi:hypothetical protein
MLGMWTLFSYRRTLIDMFLGYLALHCCHLLPRLTSIHARPHPSASRLLGIHLCQILQGQGEFRPPPVDASHHDVSHVDCHHRCRRLLSLHFRSWKETLIDLTTHKSHRLR